MDHLMKPSFCWDDSTNGPMPKAQVDARKSFQVQSIQRYLSIYLSIHPSIYLIYLIYLSIYIYLQNLHIGMIFFPFVLAQRSLHQLWRLRQGYCCCIVAVESLTRRHTFLLPEKIAPNQAST